MRHWQRGWCHGKCRERLKPRGMANQNLIVPQLSLGHGTQNYTAAPLSFSAVWAFCLGLGLCLPCLSTPSSQSERTHHGELAALFPQTLPLGPSLFGRQNLRLFLLLNATLLCRKGKERGGLLCDHGGCALICLCKGRSLTLASFAG